MINHKGSFYLGVFVFLIPFFGFPTIWKMGLVVAAGIILILMSLRIPAPRRAVKQKGRRETDNASFVEPVSQVLHTPPPVPTPASLPTPTPTPVTIPVSIPVIKIEPKAKISVTSKKTKTTPISSVRVPRNSKMDSVRKPNIGQQ